MTRGAACSPGLRRMILEGTLVAMIWTSAGAQPTASQTRQAAASAGPERSQRLAEQVDINSATPQQLNALPGFGPAYTRRVIAGRPYRLKNQLVTRGVIPQAEYERIRDRIAAHRPAR